MTKYYFQAKQSLLVQVNYNVYNPIKHLEDPPCENFSQVIYNYFSKNILELEQIPNTKKTKFPCETNLISEIEKLYTFHSVLEFKCFALCRSNRYKEYEN